MTETGDGGCALASEAGSFRDPHNQVYYYQGRVFRGLSEEAGRNWHALIGEAFFRRFLESNNVVSTSVVASSDRIDRLVKSEGWALVLEHEPIPFISYPFEWAFSMLKDAALLQLDLLKHCLEHDWSMKDATAYNVQWQGAHPVFIDTTSFEPRANDEAWIAYRQFSMMFLIPLMLRSHLDIDYLPLLRSNLEGVQPTEAVKYFSTLRRLKKGVMPHVVFPAVVENRIAKGERDNKPAKKRTISHSKTMLLGLVSGLERTVRSLCVDLKHSEWSHYECTHSYDAAEFEKKRLFVQKWVSDNRRKLVWDIGCNTGTFSRLCSPHCDAVVAIDGDHNAVEQLYLREKEAGGRKILPLVMDLANLSPNQGWRGNERKAFDQRRKPDLVICLALIHHIAISSNVPIRSFIGWLRSLGAHVILEFVAREDDMVLKLLINKKEQNTDYNVENFDAAVSEFFKVKDSQELKGRHRKILYLEPN